jgi:hypothetical protein
MNVYRVMEIALQAFSTSDLDGGEEERTGTHLIEDWADPAVAK